ncbi:MAG: imidazoleglycerol-phosphate dehydratase HisB [Clostridiales bacterium]|nr:imidazoleglycerol-phosphate dehydratase HisB [Clostridiales bacterium]
MRKAEVQRNTKETQIKLKLELDGGSAEISSGIGFFDHMLQAFALHGGFGLKLTVAGDLDVDTHHTVEDTGIALGMAFKKALGSMGGINRYGAFYVPMDESLAFCCVDISNRPYLHFRADFAEEHCGDYETCCTEEFFRAFAMNAGVTLHITVPYGSNSHHETEAMFKAFAHAMKEAVKENGEAMLSTKGVL